MLARKIMETAFCKAKKLFIIRKNFFLIMDLCSIVISYYRDYS